jgi:hypothetical protein
MRQNLHLLRGVAVRGRVSNPIRDSAPEQREQSYADYKHGTGSLQVESGLEGSSLEPPFLFGSKDEPIVVKSLDDCSPRFSFRTGGDRHFSYRSPDPSRNYAEEEEDDFDSDEAYSRSCIAAFSNLIGRRIARALIDLVGIEPNPGPSKAMVIRVAHPPAKVARKKTKLKKQKQLSSVTVTENRLGRNPASQRFQISRNPSGDYRRYVQCLNNPFDFSPVRMGGDCMMPTGLTTLVGRTVAPLGGAGELSLVFYPCAQQNLMTSVSAAANYTYTVASPFLNFAAVNAVGTAARVIAAGIRVWSLAQSTANNGLVTIGCLPRDSFTNGTPNNTAQGFPYGASTTATQGYNQFLSYLQTETYPLHCGAMAFYRPEDPLDFTFRSISLAGPNVAIGGGSANLDLTPMLVVGISGATSTSSVMVETVLHLEYLVADNVTGVISTGVGTLDTNAPRQASGAVFGDKYDSSKPGVVGGMNGMLDALSSSVNLARGAIDAYSTAQSAYSRLGEMFSSGVRSS